MLFCIKFTLAKLFFCARAKEPKPVRGFRFPRTPKRPRRGVKPQQNSLYSLFRFCFNDFSAFRVAAHTPQIFCVGFAKIGTLYKGTYCTDFTPLHTEKSLKPNCAHKKVEFLHSLTSPLSHIPIPYSLLPITSNYNFPYRFVHTFLGGRIAEMLFIGTVKG